MSQQLARYLDPSDIVTNDFLRKPTAVVMEAGNGSGKTTASAAYVATVQASRAFELIYFLEPSHAGCQNVVNKLDFQGCKILWYQGIERVCRRTREIRELLTLEIPLSFACRKCFYFRGKKRFAQAILRQQIEGSSGTIVPGVYRYGVMDVDYVCTQPVVRKAMLKPFQHELPSPLIIVAPLEVFMTPTVLRSWASFSKRQRRERKCLLVVDEADDAFFKGMSVTVPDIEPTDVDRRILERFGPKSKRLSDLVDIFLRVKAIVQQAARAPSVVESADKSREILREVARAIPLLKSFNRVSKDIADYVLEEGIQTKVFKIANTLSSIAGISRIDLALKSAEEIDEGIVLYDYDFPIRLFLDTRFPWRSFWKISLTATFPTREIARSRFLSDKARFLLLTAKKKTIRYENVYTASARVFGDNFYPTRTNRNQELMRLPVKAIKKFFEAVKLYKERFGTLPRGTILWVGNKKQLSFIARAFPPSAKAAIENGRPFRLKTKEGAYWVFVSYVGSAISRGLDFKTYDLSFVVAPLLRPPRRGYISDPIDYGRAVAEVVQSAMRIVRSPRPDTPKLIVLEQSLISPYYAKFYPAWFLELFRRNYLGRLL